MITTKDIEFIQDVWGKAIVDIGSSKEVQSKISDIILDLYNYSEGSVLFKPTKAKDVPFRNSLDSAISYFVGKNSDFPEDQGFALQPWVKVKFENSGLILEEKRALAMGHYYFTDTDGGDTKVEYTFGYIKTESGQLKIDLHHSSLPYSG